MALADMVVITPIFRPASRLLPPAGVPVGVKVAVSEAVALPAIGASCGLLVAAVGPAVLHPLQLVVLHPVWQVISGAVADVLAGRMRLPAAKRADHVCYHAGVVAVRPVAAAALPVPLVPISACRQAAVGAGGRRRRVATSACVVATGASLALANTAMARRVVVGLDRARRTAFLVAAVRNTRPLRP